MSKPKSQKSKVKSQKLKTKPQLASVKTRKLKKLSYKSFRLHKRIRHPVRLPGAFGLLRSSLGMLRRHWRVLGGILGIYGLLQVTLVRGLSSGLDLQGLKASLGASGSQFGNGVALLGALLGSSGGSRDPAGAVYQSMVIIVASLAIIWTLRQLQAGTKVDVRDGFYKGMYPLIPFILVLIVIGLQLVPLLIGNVLYSIVITNGIAVTGLEQALWILIFFMLALLSLYLICSSVFALYFVTLPDMTPMRALRSARQLVLHRRWTVLRKVLFLPLALLVLAALILLPVIIFVTPLAEVVFFVFSVVTLSIVHSYMYALYRTLL